MIIKDGIEGNAHKKGSMTHNGVKFIFTKSTKNFTKIKTFFYFVFLFRIIYLVINFGFITASYIESFLEASSHSLS